VKAFVYKYEACVKIMKLLKDIFREVEALYEYFINKTRLFQDVFREMEASV
jgi:hypothetical protein